MATAAAAAAAAVAATTVPGAVDIAPPPPPPPAVNGGGGGGGGAEDLSVVDRRNTTQRIHSLEEEAKSGEIVWVQNRMKLIRGDWAWSMAHVQITSGFLKSTTNGRLFAYRDDNAMLQCSTTFPQKWDEVVYLPFIMKSENAQVTVTKDFKEDLDKFISTLTESIYKAKGQTLLYIPPLELVGTVKEQAANKELTQRLEQIIIRWTRQIREVVRNHEEAASGEDEEMGPLTEIDFWRRRSRNISGINEQIKHPELGKALAVLERFRSSYLGQFLDLCKQIEQEAMIAEENLKYLTMLEEPCQQLANCSIRDIPLLYPKLLRCIRMIWKLSPFYNTADKITSLLCLVSNEIIKRCSAGIPLKEVFDGDEESCRVALKESIHANEAWKRVYSTMVEVAGHASTITTTAAIQLNISSSDHISPNSPQNPPRNTSPSSSSSPAAGPISHNSPSLVLPGRTNAGSLNHATAPASLNAAEVVTTGKHRDGTTQEEEQKEEQDARHISDWNSKVIFAPVEAFLQRCQDMLEVCDAQSQFSSKVKLPAFAGARGLEITKSLTDAQDIFKKLVSGLRALSYNLLDVQVTRWHNDYHKFKAGVLDLEVMMQNVMMMAFKHAASLSETIELLEAFKLMACRASICACIERMTAMVFTSCMGELTMMKRQFDLLRRRPLMDFSFPHYAGGAIWALHFQHRLTRPMALLVHATPYLLESNHGPNLGVQYNLIITSIEQYVQSQYVEWTQSFDPYLEKRLQTTLLIDVGDDVIHLHSEPNILALFQEAHYWNALGFNIPFQATSFLQREHDYQLIHADVFRMLLGNMDLVMRGLVTDCVFQLSQSLQPGIHKLTWVSSREDIATYLHEVHINCQVVESTIMQIDGSNKKITNICQEISVAHLISLEKKKIYDINEFDEKQIEHHFKAMLLEVELKLENAKNSFRDTLQEMVETFVKEVSKNAKVLLAHQTSLKLEIMFLPKQFVEAFQKCGVELWAGMSLFGMERLSNKENIQTLKELDILQSMWGLKKEWEEAYDEWKDGLFSELNVGVMETAAQLFSKRIFKNGRDCKSWTVWSKLKETVDAFKQTLPLTVDLRNPAMRKRHWDTLVETVGTFFDPTSKDFTLAKVSELRLDLHIEFICDLSIGASKELAIEEALIKIRQVWLVQELDMIQEKGIWKLKGTEELYLVLEDNRLILSSMRSNRFHLFFAVEINKWDNDLGLLSETIEMVIQVQRVWAYLESIFVGSEDIRKQLPHETKMFEGVNDMFISNMATMHSILNAHKAVCKPGLFDTFNNMDKTLEKIQKSLDTYLELKRQQFPRFYFLSNENLLDILGQAKDPRNVQVHLKKCFEGIKKLEMVAPKEGRKAYETTGIFSPDGEYLPLTAAVVLDARPEEWLNWVEAAMKLAVKVTLLRCFEESKTPKKDKWVKEFPGQCGISAGQMKWTIDCEKALEQAAAGSKTATKKLYKKWISYLNKLTAMTRVKLRVIDRNKVTSLITIEVHARDVIEKLIRVACNSPESFEWSSQLRFYWENDTCTIKQVLSVFIYGFEYQGNNGRLVITPLTDRCYITLGAALFTRRGGNPLGPAGTGKTETVKDFGKALARYVIVFNCSDGVDYKMTGTMFSGLSQTGAWACLDEFNRIEVEVLSVVASQISEVMQAIKAGLDRFVFMGVEMRLIRTCGIFVTMNPGYAGRSELPENLKAMLRPVSMMLPDFTLIAENMLFSEGFQTAKNLAKKVIAIMELSQRQLSKQDHYDYGLRSFVIPIARAAGAMKRVEPDLPEDVILQRAMRDLIKPKLIFADLPLFNALLSDLFPGVELTPKEASDLKRAIENQLRLAGMQVVAPYVTKIIQTYDCMIYRHGNMLVGRTGSGKTVAWKALQNAWRQLKEEGLEGWQRVWVYIMNSLALSNDEIYGCTSKLTHEWCDGVLARIMRDICAEETVDLKWVMFDGPVDTLWIESMNTLLDDNKILTLLNGERINMPNLISLVFEVEDLSQASPATVSRAGMIFLTLEDLGWWPYAESWIERRTAAGTHPVILDNIRKLLEKYIDSSTKIRHKCTETIPIEVLNSVMTLSKLFDLLAVRENGVHPGEGEQFVPMIETWFLFCLIWSVGASVDEAGRNTFDMWLRDQDPRFPASGLVYDYFVDFKKHCFTLWEEKLTSAYKVPPGAPFFKIQVPTIDTIRFNYVIKNLILAKRHTLVVGNVGVGKTLVIGTVLDTLPEGLSAFTMNFSAQTSSNSCQEGIEGRLEKRTKGVYAPPGGKFLICFLDDVNMPKKSVFGFMPPLELLKLWMDNGFWYDRQKQEVKKILNMQLLCAMAPPGGGRNRISQRIQACFSLLNITAPNVKQMKRIFGAILSAKLADFDNDVRLMGDSLMHVCIGVYVEVVKELLPTPSKSHYVFNMRDLAKVIQGILQGHKDTYHTKDSILQLFCHECLRTYGDRMFDTVDCQWLKDLLNTKLKDHFNTDWKAVFGNDKAMPLITSCMMPPIEEARYESILSYKELRESLEENLRECKTQPGSFGMDLVLFKDAMDHICRIHRVIMQPRGNLLLVGVGGSGRKSLTKLASFVADMKQFHDDLKLLYQAAGIGENKQQVVFLFDDTQVVEETFLEDINNILSTGEVPNLFTKDDLTAIYDGIRPTAKKAGIMETEDALYAFFLERARNNLHVVLCLSPVSENFNRRLMMFPGLVNCSTIDWFLDWPEDALSEVSIKLMEDEENVGNADAKANVCKVFVIIHKSVVDMSQKMYLQVKRKNYVTPTSYLEFAKGYRTLLKEKKNQLQNQASKLRGGLSTLNATRESVAKMQIVCQDKAVVVAQAKKECEEILVEIVSEKRVVDEQELKVNAEAARITKEAELCNIIAADCQVELDKAMPALNAAEAALNVLTKKDMSEVKAYAKPPALVEMTLQAVMTVLKRPPTWPEAKLALGDSQFLEKLMNYNKDLLVDALLLKIAKFTKKAEFTAEAIGKVSGACKGLCLWVRAMESYGYISKEVAPKKARLKAAQDNLARQEASLARAKAQLAEIVAKVQLLKDKYDKSISAKAELEAELDDLNVKLFRAEKLVSGLAGEKERWEASIINLEEGTRKLPGDCLVAAAFLSYAGPFATEYRDDLVNLVWISEVQKLEIPSSPNFTFVSFLSDAGDVREWNLQGLPADAFSTENGVMVTRSNRWPLMIDPQEQAKKWVKNMEASKGLEIVDLQMDNLMLIVERAIQLGTPVLLQDVMEEIDPSLEPILTKAFVYRGGKVYLNLGDKELDYNSNFRFYITTKLGNPHFAPEIATKTTIINFSVKEDSLEKQLLTLVVQKERPDLDKQRNELIITVTNGKKTQAACEDNILRLLITAEGPLLDNLELIATLDTSKETWEKVKQSLEVAEITAKKIEIASSAYKPCAERASLLYFILIELVAIDPMYQFSLESYTELFLISVAKSTKSDNIKERIKYLIEYHTYGVYKYTTRGLFEKHKLLLSLQILSKILLLSGEITNEEWQFFLKGAIVLDRTKQPPNPAPLWIKEEAWDNVTGLSEISPFEGLVASMTQDAAKWLEWFKYTEPEENELPGEWEEKCSELQRMMLLRCFRQDRIMFACTAFVSNTLGQKFVEPPPLDLGDSLSDSVPHSPLLFILSAGVDPTSGLRQFAGQKNMLDKFHTVALGQGQGPVAIANINEASKNGGWVFLANCQLMTSWLPKLEKVVQTLEKSNPNPDFRLWLSSVPNDKFPIGILQRSVKMTAEPPKGLRSNLLRLYIATTEESFYKCQAQEKYQKLHFALAYFHSVLLERRKFGTLGLNIPYDFNDTDFEVSNDLLTTYLDEYEETPFDALKFLISEANYGGRVTDEIDRRVLAAYLNQFYCPAILSTPNFELCSLSVYHVPDDGTLQSHREFIKTLPATDRPEAFGQHANADIAFQLSDSYLILMTIAGLQKSAGGSKAGSSVEENVLSICNDLLLQCPEVFDLNEVIKAKAFDPSALHTVLFQEIERYNILLRSIREQCTQLEKGIQGLVAMSADLQIIFSAFSRALVPAMWVKVYPTMKPLGSWTRDLVMRMTELRCWVEGTYPLVYWLAGFTYPADFLTAVLQTTARRNLIPIDTLVWEFTTVYKDEMDIVEEPKEGIFVKGLYLEGAGWDPVNDCLTEPKAMELIVPMPIILFKPVPNKKKQPKGLYACPLYLYPIRTGTRERPSYMLMIYLKVGERDSDYWVKRGTALLLSLAT
ncbi:unnamed protein product [Sphagnum troendelagicum]